jgi:membrane protein
MPIPPRTRTPGHPRPWWQAVWDVARSAYEEFSRDNGGLMAAAISFYVLLSVVPTLLVAIAVAGYVLGSSHEGMRYVLDFTNRLLPTSSKLIADLLDQVVKARGTIGGVGLLSLVWSSLQGMVTLESAINLAWGTRPRNWLASRLFSLAMLVVVGVLFLTTVAITSAQTALSELEAFGWMAESWPTAVSGMLLSLFVSTVMFAVIYRYFPTHGSRWRAAMEAGVLVAVVWELIKLAYAWYVTKVAHFDTVYGPLGSLVGLVLWVYYSCFLLVFGAEVAWLRSEVVRPEDARRLGRPAPRENVAPKARPRQRRIK